VKPLIITVVFLCALCVRNAVAAAPEIKTEFTSFHSTAPDSFQSPQRDDARVVSAYAVPIYFGLPPRNWRPIGHVTVYVDKLDNLVETRPIALRSIAAAARAHKADAVIIEWLSPQAMEQMNTGSKRHVLTVANVIRWK
jgi:hypothetical protein